MKFNQLKKIRKDIEPHEVFLDKLANSRDRAGGFSEKKFETPIQEKIHKIMFGVFFVFALILFIKTFQFQIIEGKGLLTQAENNKGSVGLVVPPRGIIYDKNMQQLVLNSPVYDLVCMPAGRQINELNRQYEQVYNEAREIAKIINVPDEEILTKFQNSDSLETLIAENLSREILLSLEARMSNFEGCKIKQNTARNYVFGPAFSHTLGYIGRINKEEYSQSNGYTINDNIGKIGIEKYYEDYLRGIAGTDNELVSGNNLVLNMDAGLQKTIYDSLENSIKNIGAKKGAAVAMNPKTGAVLAMVSYPAYDNNLFSGGISSENYNQLINDTNQPLFNRAISAKYPTGSIIKPLESAAALQENLISPDKEINDIGYILIKSKYDPEVVYRFGGVEPHGWVDMRKAIAVSSNIYFYTIGGGYENQKGLGPTRIKNYLSLFGWNEKTGIDLFGEFAGFIPSPEWKKSTKKEPWYDGDTYNLSIGQSDLQTTPLQVAVAYSAIANGGTLYKPQIVSKVLSNDSKETIKEFNPEIIRSNFIDKEHLQIVREGMRDAVEKPYGLSSSLNNLPVKVAVKTGTAQIGSVDKFNVWSGLFAPYEDPEIVLVITVENVSELGAITLPVARDAINWYFKEK